MSKLPMGDSWIFQCQAGLRGAIAPKNLGVWEPRRPRCLLKGRLGCWMSLRYLDVRYMGGSVVHIPPVQQWIWRWEIVVPTTTATGLEMGEIGKLQGLWVGEVTCMYYFRGHPILQQMKSNRLCLNWGACGQVWDSSLEISGILLWIFWYWDLFV